MNNIAVDEIWNKINIVKYKYYKPLCFQICENTENQNNWGKESNMFYQLLCKLFIQFCYFLKLNKKVQPGYSIMNILGYIPFILIIVIVSYLLLQVL